MFKEIFSKLKIIFIPCQGNNYRPKFLASEFLVYYLIILVLLRLIIVPFLIYFPKTLFFAEVSRAILIELTNEERENLGINPLRGNPELDRAALLKAQDMFNKDYFSHQGPEGTTPWHWFQKAGYDYERAGENLGIGFLDSEEIHQAWYDSPSHQANLLNSDFKDIGMAVLKGEFGGAETIMVVQLFGSPLIEEVPEEEPPKEEPAKIVSGLEQEKETEEEKEIVSESTQEPQVKGSLGFSFFRFMTTSYNDLVQKIIFFSLIVIIISLMVNILVKFNIQHKDLIWKTVLLAVILGLFILINKELIIQFIPHSLSIY